MKELSDYDIERALSPKWNDINKVHDWRNYISDEVKEMWNTFTDTQKIALMRQADDMASSEEWD